MITVVNGIKYRTCPKCKGNKTRPYTIIGIAVGGTRVKCTTCNGRGKLRVQEQTEEVKKDG